MTSGAVIEGDTNNVIIGQRTVIMNGVFLVAKRKGTIKIGERCVVYRGAILDACDGSIIIGNRCSINPYTVLYGHGGLKIGDNVLIAAHTVVIPANHGFKMGSAIRNQPATMEGITIGNDVWIGANVTILDGVEIGAGAVVGAGSVVTKDIEPYSINVGNPAHKIGMRKD